MSIKCCVNEREIAASPLATQRSACTVASIVEVFDKNPLVPAYGPNLDLAWLRQREHHDAHARRALRDLPTC